MRNVQYAQWIIAVCALSIPYKLHELTFHILC